jgi:hypothetical protein
VQGDRQLAMDLLAVSEGLIKPGLQRSYAMFLPSVMLGRPADPAEAMPRPGTITRPWQRQLVDPGYLNLAIGVVIGDLTEARPRALERLRVFGKNGSPTASALAEAVGGDTESLRAMGFIGLVELLSYRSVTAASPRGGIED